MKKAKKKLSKPRNLTTRGHNLELEQRVSRIATLEKRSISQMIRLLLESQLELEESRRGLGSVLSEGCAQRVAS